MTALRVFGVTVLAVWGATTPTVMAHEIGTTQVRVHIDTHQRFAVDIVTDADSLLEKLESVAQREGAKANPSELLTRLSSLEDCFRQRVALRFDSEPARADVRFAVAPRRDDTAPAVATVHLSGTVPEGARSFTWAYGWTFASYALRVSTGDEEAGAAEWLEGGDTSAPHALRSSAPRQSRSAIAQQYFWLGLTHIVPKGFDHVLFVLGLFLLGRGWRVVLWQVSAFTVAHSITLGLGMYGLIGVPSSVVEPLIALSIAYVALENLVLKELRPWRVALVFAFGLLHGMGFAGVLSELGLPRGEFVTALVTFNTGVEGGQLLVIAAAFAAVGWHRGHAAYRQHVVLPASLAIACTAVYWTLDRLPL